MITFNILKPYSICFLFLISPISMFKHTQVTQAYFLHGRHQLLRFLWAVWHLKVCHIIVFQWIPGACRHWHLGVFHFKKHAGVFVVGFSPILSPFFRIKSPESQHLRSKESIFAAVCDSDILLHCHS